MFPHIKGWNSILVDYDLCQKTRREPSPSVRIHIGSVSEQHHTKIAVIKSEHFLSINNGITTTCLKAHDIYLSYLVSRAPHKDSKVTVNYFLDLARAVDVPVGRHSGGRLAMTLVATKNVILFFFFLFFFLFSVVTFSHRRSAWIKNPI